MTPNQADRPPLEEPLAELERQLINEYVVSTGHDLESLHARTDAEARRILTDASRYASEKLTEVETKSHYLHTLRGQQ